ncbi:MAG: hypothetical protein JSV88_05810 [Candidatus Aminicenantes bacterium]|nr:MAG: hypothetical protein JSV88_05810 [Candidatus Aminicenantes bacterium]
MTDLDWSKIGNGPTFESLSAVIVRHEDFKARVYDRPGKDAAMDIKSGDGNIVYQAKYIGDQRFDTAIKESLKELDKIKKYKKETHPNYEFWVDVKKWCLITNARLNPTDEKKWQEQVVDKFKTEGFEDVMLWHNAILIERIIKLPHVKQEYFEGENRVIISLSEAYETIEIDQIVSFAISLDYLGRKSELKALCKFLKSSDKRVLPIHGPGGVGKTRFALQASIFANEQEDWDVYWANVQTMALSSNWFQTIIPSRKTLLVIDEPEDADTIKSLLEQISLVKMSNWKVLVVTRSPKDPVLNVLRNPRSKILETEIELSPLDVNNIEALSYNLLTKCEELKAVREDDLRIWAIRIGKISNGFPIWTTIAVFLIKEGKSINDLPNDEYKLAKLYVEEIIKYIPIELNGDQLTFREFLQLLALFQPINVETDKELLDFIAQRINLQREEYIHALLSNLINRKVCKKRGRLVEIKPDVIRDHVLYEWLGKNKHNAEALVKSILGEEKFPQPKMALKQLARLELSYKLKNENFPVLDPVVSELKKLAKNGTLLNQYNVLEFASEFCFSRPLALVEVSQILRNNFRPNEKIKDQLWGEVELSHIDLVLNLPWEIYNIGRYSLNNEEQKKIFMELIELAKYEYHNINSEKEYLKNDGKRALVLIQRLLPGGKEQFRPFDKIAYSWIEKKLEEFITTGDDELHIFEGLASIILSTEREDFFSEGMSFVITKYKISPTSEAGVMRRNLRLKLWEMVEGRKIDSKRRKIVWKLLKKSHRQANKASDPWERKTNQLHIKNWENELKDDLERVKKILQEKKVPLAEMSEVRGIWDWHLRVDKRDILKKLAVECEEIMNSNNEVSNFGQLYQYIYDDSQKKREIPKKIALNLDSKEKIFEFVSNAYDFAGENRYFDGIREVAYFLGQDFLVKNYIRQYVSDVFKNEHSHMMHVYTASHIFASEINKVRKNEPNNLFDKFFEYYSIVRNEEAKQVFLNTLYPRYFPGGQSLLIDQDLDILSRIVRTKCYPDMAMDTLFYVLGYMFYINFDEDKRIIDYLWSGTKCNDAAKYYSSLVEGIWSRTIFSDGEEFAFEFPDGFFKWLIGQLNLVPDLDEIGSLFEYKLLQIQKKTGDELDVCWFYSFLQERVDKIEKNILKDGKIISSHNEIINCVKKIRDANEVTETILASFRKLLEYNNHESSLRFFLPEILIKLDPGGIILPDLIVEKLRECEFQQQENLAENECFKLIRYAAYYQINSASWRAIAIEACKSVHNLDSDQKKRIYSALLNKHFSSWAGMGDEISAYYLNAVKRAQKDLEDEDEEILKDLMRYRLQIAEIDLKNEQQREEEMEI